ncbi:Cell pattern formation-associated protein STUA [Apiospora saccharicola]|uniref:Cell pattern formation-associated protein STUA n=1 Tax=Apiospora saccharicola TaxID=335842 RepID=A0ABR1WII8_9PEZI
MSERLPPLPFPQPPPLAYSSGTSSPRVSSIASSTSSNGESQSSFTSAASSNGPKTPSPNLPVSTALSGPPSQPIGGYDQYSAMNSAPAPDMYYPQHMSAGPAPSPQTVTSSGLSQYGHQPAPLLHPGHAQYSAPYQQQYGYANGLTSPQSAPPVVSNSMGPAQNVLPLPAVNQSGMGSQYTTGMDTTGQVAPPGMKPRVTATLWEDEGSLCFQVEARGICVARREDNHMINGTKLLNVAGMTRGRRDGILKSEKVRHVVKIGPMHLKGVWIPFERALDFANKEKITEMLYPLFVHNIGALLYHPTNQTRTNQVMAAAERRKQEQSQMRNTPAPAPPGGVLPSIQQHHHHMGLPPQSSLPSHNSSGRPSLDRAHTFPTPPTSASSVMGSMGASENFQWSQQNMSGAPSANPMSIDTSLSNARSMPATPATTPPGSSMQSMQSYPQGTQPYDNSRGVYNTATHQSPYPASHSSPQDRNSYGQPNSYMRNDMAPPTGRPAAPSEQDVKPPNGMHQSQAGEQVPQSAGEDETEHEGEYTHDSGAYDANRTAYNYNAPPVAPLSGEHSHLSPEMTGSPGHQAGSGRATPRTAAPPQPFYAQQGYNTPPADPSSLQQLNDMGGSLQNGYAPPIMNGAGGPMKRGRDDDDDRALSGSLELKRRKTLTLMDGPGPMPAPTFDAMNRPSSTLSQRRR